MCVQSCPTLCDPLDCNLPGSSVHGILQAGILEWVAISSFRGFSWPRNWTCISCYSWIGKWILLPLRHLGSPKSDHIMPLMKALWWLPIGLRIKPRVLIILVHKAFQSHPANFSIYICLHVLQSHQSHFTRLPSATGPLHVGSQVRWRSSCWPISCQVIKDFANTENNLFSLLLSYLWLPNRSSQHFTGIQSEYYYTHRICDSGIQIWPDSATCCQETELACQKCEVDWNNWRLLHSHFWCLGWDEARLSYDC